MTSIGETLRGQRQRRNLEIPRIADELKISARFLEAMEHDDFGKLPGGVFTKSFVRQYAVFLGLDGEELAAEMERALEPEPEPAELVHKPKPDVPGIKLVVGYNWQSIGERPASLPSWVRAGVLLVALMLVCSGVYWWWQRPRRQVLAHEVLTPPPAVPARQAAPPALNPRTPAGAPETAPAAGDPLVRPASAASAAAPPVTTPAAQPQIPVPPPNPNATVHVGITAEEPVWMRAEVNGKYLFEATLQAHESRNIDADGQVSLRLGNAGGVTITLNGKPVGEVGPKGQIRTVQFTSGGFQIVSPPKSLDPPDRR